MTILNFLKEWGAWIALTILGLFLIFGKGCTSCSTSNQKEDDDMDLYKSATHDLNSAYRKQMKAEKSREKYFDATDEFCSEQAGQGLGFGNGECKRCGESHQRDTIINDRSINQTVIVNPGNVKPSGEVKKNSLVGNKVRTILKKIYTHDSHPQEKTSYGGETTSSVTTNSSADCKECTCSETPFPSDYKSYARWDLLKSNGCHGFKNPRDKSQDFRFKSLQDAQIFWDANQNGMFKGYERNF